jgi:hypothetical protein
MHFCVPRARVVARIRAQQAVAVDVDLAPFDADLAEPRT